MWTRGLGTRLDAAALDEVDRRVEDHLIARLNRRAPRLAFRDRAPPIPFEYARHHPRSRRRATHRG
jgi:hypothetical protein